MSTRIRRVEMSGKLPPGDRRIEFQHESSGYCLASIWHGRGKPVEVSFDGLYHVTADEAETVAKAIRAAVREARKVESQT